jgi:hypothetical protein
MHFSIYDVFHSQNSHQDVSASISAILRALLVYKNTKMTNMVNCVTTTP